MSKVASPVFELRNFLILLIYRISYGTSIYYVITKMGGGPENGNFWLRSVLKVSTLKYPIKEHALLLIFNILPPLLAFFHPARLLIFRKISTLLVYSIPARLFLSCKEVFTPCSFSFCLFIFDLHLIANANKYNKKL